MAHRLSALSWTVFLPIVLGTAITGSLASASPLSIENENPHYPVEENTPIEDQAPQRDRTVEVTPLQVLPDQPWFPSEAVFQAIEADLAGRSDWEPGQSYVSRHIFQTWADGCMALAAVLELCDNAPIDGWHIEIGLGSRQRAYTYHTDLTGERVRYFDPDVDRPVVSSDRILYAAAEDQGLAYEDLTLQAIEPHFFRVCSGLIERLTQCNEEGYLGWRAVVTDGIHQWVYTTALEGALVTLQSGASLITTTYEPVFQFNDWVVGLGASRVIFQSAYISGIAGGGSVIATLTEDNSLERRLIYPDGSYEVVGQRVIREAELNDFLAVLDEVGFVNFYGLDYQAPDGAEQYSYYQLNDHRGFVYFDDHSFEELPPALQTVMTAWHRLLHP